MIICEIQNFILPANDILLYDLRKIPLGKMGQNFLLDNALFCDPSVKLKFWFDILLIQFDKNLKYHIYVSLFLHQELPFPLQRLQICSKVSFKLPLALPLPGAQQQQNSCQSTARGPDLILTLANRTRGRLLRKIKHFK